VQRNITNRVEGYNYEGRGILPIGLRDIIMRAEKYYQ
jgi:hypothetical protein